MPSGSVAPRSRAIKLRMNCAFAEGTNETPRVGSLVRESAQTPMPNKRADVAARRRKVIVGSPPHVIRTQHFASGTRNLEERSNRRIRRDSEENAFGLPFLIQAVSRLY
jgi:hypothetical protein